MSKNIRHRNDEFDSREVRRGSHPGDRYVRVVHDPKFTREAPGRLVVTARGDEPTSGIAKLIDRTKKILIGAPLESARASHERLTKPKALAVLSSDALSSVAYAPEEILIALMLAGTAALVYSVPIAMAIVGLMVVVAFSYSQTIKAYPQGGGSYVVASDNLGRLPGLTAGAALIIGYVLTVAVSIAAGVDQLIAALPWLAPYRITLGIGFISLITLANLRGIREAGTIFAVPTYAFILGMFSMIGVGLYRLFSGAPLPVAQEAAQSAASTALPAISVFLVLRAFAAGCAAMTGVEAISDGVPAFKPPEWRNARTTLVWMVLILGTTFLSLAYLAYSYGIRPDEEGNQTVISQVARLVFGDGLIYYLLQASTVLILILAANTAFSDFPRLSYFMARDGFLPHQLEYRGDRLAYSNGIISLGVVSAGLLAVFAGDTHALIPLYAVGVFLAFTLSQSGMVLRWWRNRAPGWRWSILINGFGALTTALVTLIVSVVRFSEGAWIVVVVIPILILLFLGIKQHYTRAAGELRPETPLSVEEIEHTILVPIAKLNRVALQSLVYARSISPNVTAIHVSDDKAENDALQAEWSKYEHLADLVIINSPYRSVVTPILNYIDAIDRRNPNDTVTVVLPEFVAKHWWERLLHNQTALRLKTALLFRPGTVVTNVPYHLKR